MFVAVVKIFNKGFNYSQDGPGNRLIYHLQGCNMRCCWCANPEGMNPDGELIVDDKQLIDNICPHGAIHEQTLERVKCSSCEDFACTTKYRTKGIRFSCIAYDTEAILEEIKSCMPMFFDGGGVTFTGGEPTMQFEALKELLTGAKGLGVNTCIESNATHRDMDELFPFIDYPILDFKFADEEKHIKHTGITDKYIKKNLEKAFNSGKTLLIRIPMVNGINAFNEEILEMIEFLKTQNTKNTKFELLPYHEYGKVKWEKCGKAYTVTDGFVSRDKIKDFEKLFLKNNLVIKKT